MYFTIICTLILKIQMLYIKSGAVNCLSTTGARVDCQFMKVINTLLILCALYVPCTTIAYLPPPQKSWLFIRFKASFDFSIFVLVVSLL